MDDCTVLVKYLPIYMEMGKIYLSIIYRYSTVVVDKLLFIY